MVSSPLCRERAQAEKMRRGGTEASDVRQSPLQAGALYAADETRYAGVAMAAARYTLLITIFMPAIERAAAHAVNAPRCASSMAR